MKRIELSLAARANQRRQMSGWTVERIRALIRTVARVFTAEHARALHAANRAATPRQRQAELRAMYVPGVDDAGQGDDEIVPPSRVARTSAVRKEPPDMPSWSAPFPKP